MFLHHFLSFSQALLDHTRSSYELEVFVSQSLSKIFHDLSSLKVLLNHDPNGPIYQHGERMHLNRSLLERKTPNVQMLLTTQRVQAEACNQVWSEEVRGSPQCPAAPCIHMVFSNKSIWYPQTNPYGILTSHKSIYMVFSNKWDNRLFPHKFF